MSQPVANQPTVPQEPIGLLDAFKARHSSRTYLEKDFPQQKKQNVAQIVTEANSIDTPFNSEGVEISSTTPGLGRIGVISGEAGWLVEKIPLNRKSENEGEKPTEDPNVAYRKAVIDVSFKMQIAVMKLAQHHIQTVWIAGTYNEGEAERRFEGFKIPAVVAFGEESASPHLLARVMKFFSPAPSRLPFEQVFYDVDRKKPITEADLDSSEYPSYFKDFVSSLRSGPSALNRQSWRFAISGKEVHLFDAYENTYSAFDIGIALGNLFLLKEIRGETCNFEVRNPAPESTPIGGTYVCTVVYSE